MALNEPPKDKLGKLEKKLYSRNAPEILGGDRTNLTSKVDSNESIFYSQTRRDSASKATSGQLPKPGSSPETGRVGSESPWQGMKSSNFDELASKMSKVAQNKHRFLRKILIISLSFFIVAAGVAAFVFFGGINMVSSKNVDIQIEGPASVGGGQEVSYGIKVLNNNNTDLQSAALIVEYPEGTRSSTDQSQVLQRERFPIDSIKSGQSYTKSVKAVFFGEKGTVKSLHVSLEYRIQNSSALFYKEKNYDLSISSAPVILTATYPKEANSGQDILFSVEAASNSKDPLSNLIVNVEYPFGFVFKSSSPSPSYGNNIWKISNLSPSEKRTIKITGNIIGQDNEERVFRVNAGNPSDVDERQIAVPLANITESLTVKKPFITMDVSLDQNPGNITATGGRTVNAEIVLHNNLPTRLFNTTLNVSFKGGGFNPNAVNVQNNGFFQSSNNTILWDSRAVAELADIAPGTEEHFAFQLTPYQFSQIAQGQKPEIEMTILAKGQRVLESGSAEDVLATETRKIALATDLVLTAKTLRSLGNLENSGPIPPKANAPTTYTVYWSISNSFNQVSGAEVRATLPSYVKWTNQHDPGSELISYDSLTNEVVWKAGSVLPSTGFGSSKKEVYFQVELLPSLSQVGQTPFITGEAKLTGQDKVTNMPVAARAGAVSTLYSDDPSYRQGDERVVQ